MITDIDRLGRLAKCTATSPRSPIFYASPIDTLTFLFTDIEGSTALLRRLGDDVYAKVLDDHQRVIRASLEADAGKEEGTQGDAFFALFNSPRACVAAAPRCHVRLPATSGLLASTLYDSS